MLEWKRTSVGGLLPAYRAKLGQLGELEVCGSDRGTEWELSILGTARNNKVYPSAEEAIKNAERLALRYVREALKLLEQ